MFTERHREHIKKDQQQKRKEQQEQAKKTLEKIQGGVTGPDITGEEVMWERLDQLEREEAQQGELHHDR